MSDQTSVNPYAPTQLTAEVTVWQRPQRSLVLSALTSVCALAFIGFTIILLRSNAPDRTAGMLFLLNVPVVIGFVISSFNAHRLTAVLGLAASGVQVLIALVMILMRIGDVVIVLGINGGIAAGFLVLATIASRLTRMQRISSDEATGNP